MKTCCLVIMALLLQVAGIAQYNGKESALGIRAGGATGITYKKFSSGNFAFEALVAKDFEKENDGFFLSALFQNNVPLAGRRFCALIGGGPTYHFGRQSLGASGIIGFDWRVFNTPVNFQLDWMPSYYFGNNNGFSYINTALSVRYILNERKVYGTKAD